MPTPAGGMRVAFQSTRNCRGPTSSVSAASLPRLAPFVHARLAPSIYRSALASRAGPAGGVFGQQQLRLLTSSRPFLAPNPSTPTNADSATTPTKSADAVKEVAVQDEKKTAVAKKDSSKEKGTRMQRIWAVVKKEALHYYHGAKLLGKETRISARLVRKLIAGRKLTRREHRQVRLSIPTPAAQNEPADSPGLLCSSSVLRPICSA